MGACVRWFALFGAGIAPSVSAFEYNADIEMGVGYSSNPARVPEGDPLAQESGLGLVRIGAQFEHNSRRLQTFMRSDLQVSAYNRDDFEDERLGGIDFALSAELVPEVLQWTLIETWGQQVSDPFRPVGVGNREDVNYLTTGPQINVPLGARNFLTLSGQYSDVRYEETPLDNERSSNYVAVGRRFSQPRTLSLMRATSSVEFEQPTPDNQDFETEDWFVRLDSATPRGTLQIDVGNTTLLLPDGETDGPLLRGLFSRQVSTTATLTVELGREFSDAGESFRRFQGASIDVGGAQDVVGTADPFEDRYLTFGFTAVQNDGLVDVRLGRSDEDFQDDTLIDRRVASIETDWSRRISRAWTGTLGLLVRRREFVQTTQIDDDYIIQVTADRRFGRNLRLTLQAEQFRRTSNLLATVVDHRVLVTAGYSLGQLQTQRGIR